MPKDQPIKPRKPLPPPPEGEQTEQPEVANPEDISPKVPSAPQTAGPQWAGPFWPMSATSEFKDDPDNPASFSNVERTIRKQPFEWGGIFDKTGKAKVVLTANSHNSVPIPADLVDFLRKLGGTAIFTHNHPENSSFSTDDVDLFIGAMMREIRIVSQRYVYSLSDPTMAFHGKTMARGYQRMQGWALADIQKQFDDELKSQDVKRLMTEIDVAGKARMMAMVMGTPVEYEEHIIVTDLINRRLFTKWGLTYNVVHIDEA